MWKKTQQIHFNEPNKIPCHLLKQLTLESTRMENKFRSESQCVKSESEAKGIKLGRRTDFAGVSCREYEGRLV